MQVLLDFQYSDSWADADKQIVTKARGNIMDAAALADTLYLKNLGGPNSDGTGSRRRRRQLLGAGLGTEQLCDAQYRLADLPVSTQTVMPFRESTLCWRQNPAAGFQRESGRLKL